MGERQGLRVGLQSPPIIILSFICSCSTCGAGTMCQAWLQVLRRERWTGQSPCSRDTHSPVREPMSSALLDSNLHFQKVCGVLCGEEPSSISYQRPCQNPTHIASAPSFLTPKRQHLPLCLGAPCRVLEATGLWPGKPEVSENSHPSRGAGRIVSTGL